MSRYTKSQLGKFHIRQTSYDCLSHVVGDRPVSNILDLYWSREMLVSELRFLALRIERGFVHDLHIDLDFHHINDVDILPKPKSYPLFEGQPLEITAVPSLVPHCKSHTLDLDFPDVYSSPLDSK